MANLGHVQRVVFRHDWIDLGEWVAALAELSELTDDEIDGIVAADRAKLPEPIAA